MNKLEKNQYSGRKYKICIVGGAGHVGLPLGIAFAAAGHQVTLYDINKKALETIGKGILPFIEYDAESILCQTLNKSLFLSGDKKSLHDADVIIITIGTPVDEYLNPKLRVVLEMFHNLRSELNPDQTIIVRSTVYPRTLRMVRNELEKDGRKGWKIAYCPERIAEGYAIRELRELPQLAAALDESALSVASDLFLSLAPSVIQVTMEEAELAKLFSNAWRYIQFAAANQFYMISAEFGVDFNRVREAMVEGYGRASNLPVAGFAAGPCLLKDTMQLFAFNNNHFMMGQAAMAINEGLPGFIVEQIRKKYDLKNTRVGILGMAFKGNIDDTRDSLSYKLGKILRFHGAIVRYSDEFAKDPTFISKEELVNSCDVVIVGAPHEAYKTLPIPAHVDVVDSWNITRS